MDFYLVKKKKINLKCPPEIFPPTFFAKIGVRGIYKINYRALLAQWGLRNNNKIEYT
jgi:hypothetical protein